MSELTKKSDEAPITEPQPVETNVAEGYKTPEQLIFKAEFDKALKWMDDRIANTNYVMGVIIVVLAIGFLALLVAVIAILVQLFGINGSEEARITNALEEQTKTMQLLQEELKDLRSRINSATGSGLQR